MRDQISFSRAACDRRGPTNPARTTFAMLRSGVRRSRMRRAVLAFVAACVVATTVGCTTHSVKTAQLQQDEVGTGGVTYFLPMRFATVSFDRTRADSKAAEAVAKTKEALKADEVSLKAAEGSASANAGLLEALKQDGFDQASETFKGAQLELVKARRDVVAKMKSVSEAKAAFDQASKALQQYNDSQPMCGYVDSIKVDLLPPVPDTRARYELHLDRSSFRHDTFKIGTTPSGLLKTVDALLVDQTGEILVSLAQSIAAAPLAMFAASVDKPLVLPEQPVPTCDQLSWQPLSLRMLIDPAEGRDWESASRRISSAARVQGKLGQVRTFNYDLRLDARSLSMQRPPSIEYPQPPESGDDQEPRAVRRGTALANGILYRRERTLLVDVELDRQPVGAFALVVPNNAPADIVYVDATTFATNTTKVGFDNGMLVSVDSDYPSPVLEVVSLPWKIARATVGILAEVIQLRVNYATGQAGVLEQQVALLEQMEALIEAQRSLDATRIGNTDEEDEGSGDGG